MIIQKTLPNGIRIIGDYLPHYRSTAIGVWIGAGSVDETPAENGISHFIEHMMFKGTSKRSARDIAVETDAIGANLNAFTAKECTCYHIRLMDKHLDFGFDLLADIVFNSVFDEKEMEKEKGVVAEEILMVEDTPEDLVHEVLAQAYYGDHPLSKTILGPRENVLGFTRENITSYMAKHYTTNNIIIALAGNFDENRVYDLAQQYFGGLSEGVKDGAQEPLHTPRSVVLKRAKDVEQVHVCFGLPSFGMNDDDAYTVNILNNVFGGGMSSRLFQKIREERGLVYSVFSYPSSYSTTGYFTVYYGANPNKAKEAADIVLEEMRRIKKKGVSAEEIERAREQLKGAFILGQESAGSRMNSLGKSLLLRGKVLSEEETLAKIDAVTRDDIARILPIVFDEEKMSAAMVGRINGLDLRIGN